MTCPLTVFVDTLEADLLDLIDRRFGNQRTIQIDGLEDGRYCATIDGKILFPPTPNLDAVIRFVRTFAIQTAGVVVDEVSVEWWRCQRAFGQHSVRVPSNVVPLRIVL